MAIRKRSHAATRRDVAARAGVAPSTVSLVLNRTPGPRIPEETRERVMAAARELGYQSSTIARALVTGKTQTVGVVLHFVDRPFISYVSKILDAFWIALNERGYRMLMAEGTAESCVAGLFRERSVDGLLVMVPPYASADAELRDMVDAGFPAVFAGSLPGAIKADYVDVDNVLLGQRATTLLLEAGHRRIVHLAGPLVVNSSARDRRTGYESAMRAAGLPVDESSVIDCSYNGEFVSDRLGAAMDRGLEFTAIFAANHSMAHGAQRALIARGLRVPEDVSITTIDLDAWTARPIGCPITCFEQPLGTIGAQAAALLMERMDGLVSGPRSVLLPGTLIPGGSVAPPRGGRD